MLTLYIEEYPGTNGCPMQVIIGKTAPIAQKANCHIRNQTANGPGNGICQTHLLRWQKSEKKEIFYFITKHCNKMLL